HINILARAGRVKAALAFADEAIAKAPKSVALVRAAFDATLSDSDLGAQRVRGARLADHADATIEDINRVAWVHAFIDADLDAARALGKRVEAKSAELESGVANTLAAIAAESDDPVAAYTYERKSVGKDDPARDSDWYVLGRI